MQNIEKKIAAKKLLQSPPFRFSFSSCYERMHYWLLSNFLHGDFGHLRRLNLQYKPFQSISSLIHMSILQFISWSYKFCKIKKLCQTLVMQSTLHQLFVTPLTPRLIMIMSQACTERWVDHQNLSSLLNFGFGSFFVGLYYLRHNLEMKLFGQTKL